MKKMNQTAENQAEIALRTCLERVPFLRIESVSMEPKGDLMVDFLVTLTLASGNKKDLIVEIKNNGQPRIAREAVNQLLRYGEIYPGSYGVFIAPYISLQAAEICSKDGIGYVDLAGNCRLSFDQVYIEQRGNPNPFSEKRDLRSLYSPKAERVLRVFLCNPEKVWKTQDLAEEAKVSLGQVANIKKLLVDREWIFTSRDGFSLREKEKLLEEWSQNYTYRKNKVRDFYTIKNLLEIEADLAEVCNERGIKYALTGFSGAARIAPAVRYQRAMTYLDGDIDDIASTLQMKEVPSGANLMILTPYDDGVFYRAQEFDNIKIASPVQIYLDLKEFRGRGEEAAKAVLDEVIRPTW